MDSEKIWKTVLGSAIVLAVGAFYIYIFATF